MAQAVDKPETRDGARARLRWPLDLTVAILLGALTYLAYRWTAGPTILHQSNQPHFVLLADAILHGHLWIDPSRGARLGDVTLFAGRYYVSFPPMPAIVLLPFVAAFGPSFDDRLFSVVLGAIDVALTYLLTRRLSYPGFAGDGLSLGRAEAASIAMLLGLGTVHFYAALAGTVWFIAHVVSVTFVLLYLLECAGSGRPLLAGAALAGAFLARTPTIFGLLFWTILLLRRSKLRSDVVVTCISMKVFRLSPNPTSENENSEVSPEPPLGDDARPRPNPTPPRIKGIRGVSPRPPLGDDSSPMPNYTPPQGREIRGYPLEPPPQVAIKAAQFAAPLAVAVAVLLAQNVVRFGSPLDFGYLSMRIAQTLRPDLLRYGQFSPHFLPRNLAALFATAPLIAPIDLSAWLAAIGGPVGLIRQITTTGSRAGVPFPITFDPWGTSLWAVSPALVFSLRLPRRQDLALASAAWLSAIVIAVPDLLYYNTGWVQYGYRFALDFIPFLLILTAMGLRRPLHPLWRPLFVVLLAISVASNFLGARWFLHLPPY